MGLDLNKVEKRIEDLLARAGHENAEEQEARTSAVLAARLIRRENQKGSHDLHVIDVKEYDAVWQKELDDLRLKAGFGGSQAQFSALQKELQAAKQEVQAARQEARSVNELAMQARQREIDARRQVEECQRVANKYSSELQSLKARPASIKPEVLAQMRGQADALQRELQAARQEARVASDLARKARDAEAEAKRVEAEARKAEAEAKNQVNACSNLVMRLKSESKSESPTSTELVKLQGQVKDLTFKVTAAQASAHACANLREEELAHYERQRSKIIPATKDTAYALFAGLLAGGVVTMVGAVVLRKIMEPASPAPSPTLPARTTSVPARTGGR